MKPHCAYCGTRRFGLVRRSGFYVRGYFPVQLQFCTREHEQMFAAEYARVGQQRALQLSFGMRGKAG